MRLAEPRGGTRDTVRCGDSRGPAEPGKEAGAPGGRKAGMTGNGAHGQKRIGDGERAGNPRVRVAPELDERIRWLMERAEAAGTPQTSAEASRTVLAGYDRWRRDRSTAERMTDELTIARRRLSRNGFPEAARVVQLLGAAFVAADAAGKQGWRDLERTLAGFVGTRGHIEGLPSTPPLEVYANGNGGRR